MVSDLQKKIIEEMNVKPEIDPKEEIRKSIDFMKEYAIKNSFLKSFVLGISGGQDSTLLGKLAQMAVEELRDEQKSEKYKFIAVSLPYGEQQDEDVAREAIDWMGADEELQVNIKPSVDEMVDTLTKAGESISDFNKGNIKARARMIAQYAIAGENGGVVLGTDHPAENITGFFTKYGDGGTDINPLFRLNKRQGISLMKELDSPSHFYEKTPTADLEDNNPGEADEDQLGVSYEAIDNYLEGEEVSEEDRKTIEKWYNSTKHKRHLPVTIFDDFWK